MAVCWETSSVYGSVLGEQLRVWESVQRAAQCMAVCWESRAVLAARVAQVTHNSSRIPCPLPLLCLPAPALPFPHCLALPSAFCLTVLEGVTAAASPIPCPYYARCSLLLLRLLPLASAILTAPCSQYCTSGTLKPSSPFSVPFTCSGNLHYYLSQLSMICSISVCCRCSSKV